MDNGRQISTGFGECDKAQAEIKLEEYIQGQPVHPRRTYFVYFVSCDQEGFPIKIGISESYVRRFTCLQTALPYDVKVLATLAVSDPRFERVLHRKFAGSRLRGEWFERTDALMRYIETIEPPPITLPPTIDRWPGGVAL